MKRTEPKFDLAEAIYSENFRQLVGDVFEAAIDSESPLLRVAFEAMLDDEMGQDARALLLFATATAIDMELQRLIEYTKSIMTDDDRKTIASMARSSRESRKEKLN